MRSFSIGGTLVGVLLVLLGIGVVLGQSLSISEVVIGGGATSLIFERSDLASVALLAAMREPIDWAQPLAIVGLGYPGTSLLIADGLPLLSLPLRILFQSGLDFDVTAVVGVGVRIAIALSPLSVYLLARACGAGRGSAFVSSCLGVFVHALMYWNSALTLGLALWPLLALLLRELLLVDRERVAPAIRAALLGGALWWCYPYLGAIGFALVAPFAFVGVVRRSRPWFFPLTGSTIGLLLLLMSDIGFPDGVSIASASRTLSALPSLLTLSPVSPLRSGISGPEAQWGLLIAISFVISLPLLARRSTPLFVGVVALALLSLGAFGEGGLLPSQLFDLPLISLLDDVDRLFAPAALIGVAMTPLIVERAARRLAVGAPWSNALLLTAHLSLVGAVAVSSIGYIEDLRSPLESLRARWLELPDRSADKAEIAAFRELLIGHERLIFLPMPFCGQAESRLGATVDARLREMTIGLAGIAAGSGVDAISFQPGRSLFDASVGNAIARSPLCRPEFEPAPPRSLVVLSALVDDRQMSHRWRQVGEALASCSEPIDAGLLDGIIVCSDDTMAIARFEASLADR